MVRFYSSGAPRWWPYHVVVPHRAYSAPRVILDNGMWAYWKEGRRPPVDVWLARIARVASSLESEEVIVILPDWLGDPRFTLEAAREPIARRLCRDYKCMAVAHSFDGLMGYYVSARELVALDYMEAVAAPLKLPCKNGRRIPAEDCQARIVSQVVAAAREHGLHCVHGLGVLLKPRHVKRLVGMGLSSFDSSSWTRPNSSVLRRLYPFSAKNNSQKEFFFKVALMRLLEAWVPLELPPDVVDLIHGVVAGG